MILHPAVLALSAGSVVVTFMVLSAAFYGTKILKHWNLKSGSELQLNLERQTYLISTIMIYAFGFQLFSLFLFIFTADTLADLFTGAMCAAGTLNVNGFGYPALLFKIINFILGGVWLIVNYTDNQAIDYPLIKKKYAFLLVVAPFILVEMILQGAYFLNLNAHVITSCCGSLFSPQGKGIGAIFISALPTMQMKIVFYVAIILTGIAGFMFYSRGRPVTGYFFSLMCVITFIVSVAALISFISLYFYQLPTHHCPFCILQKEYCYAGYLLYVTLLGGVVGGVSTGALLPARNVLSLREILPGIERRLTFITVFFYLIFTIIVSCTMIFTHFRLEGY
jgi:hypothetical protein